MRRDRDRDSDEDIDGEWSRKKQLEKECMQVTDSSNVKMNNTINPVITYSNLTH